jgi:hypothetical protein
VLLPRFPYLVTLDIHSVNWRDTAVDALAAALPASVHQLGLYSNNFASSADIVTLPTATPRLSHLNLRYCPCDLAAVSEREMRRPMVALEHLEVADTWREIGPPD